MCALTRALALHGVICIAVILVAGVPARAAETVEASAASLPALGELRGGTPPTDAPLADPPFAARPFTGVPGALSLPEILSVQDADLYREIFALQERGLWQAADKRIGKLKDPVLMGHVLAQRYLHPTAYRSRYAELRDWLKNYADHPDAARVHDLALRRKPAKAPAPPAPRDRFTVSADNIDPAAVEALRVRRTSPAERSVLRHVAREVRSDRLSASERYLEQASIVRSIGASGADRARALVAAGWFRRGDTSKAHAIAAAAARRSGAQAPHALWWAGLAAFRLGRFEEARRHFELLANARGLASEDEAAAAFWAGRAALRGGDMARVGPFMDRAAAHDRTFYGQIAARLRGAGPAFDWRVPEVVSKDLVAFSGEPGGRRVLALIQLGEEARAEAELRSIRVGLSPSVLRIVALLADAADMPGAALRAGRVLLRGTGERLDSALYPLPHWVPDGGYQIDRALLYALARQESAFNVKAHSHAGARGLMQLMPATARYMADDRRRFRGRGGAELFDPRVNLALGQRYVDYLLTGEIVAGNLILGIAAYNGGPGNIARWQREISHGSDPLVFIETIPVRETRLFVKAVLQNLWAYRARLGQSNPSLDALAGGRWPVYVSLDGAGFGVAEERP